MRIEGLSWENIDRLKEQHITYLLYKEGKSIDVISVIRNIPKTEVEKHIIQCKLELNSKKNSKDSLVEVISMNKKDRLKYLSKLSNEEKEDLINEIIKRYASFKNSEDKSIIIWLIGELGDQRLLPYLRMELKSNRANQRRLACSALGKIGAKESKQWLEEMIQDKNPQVRQYAVKALGVIGDGVTIEKLKKVLESKNEKDYVKRAAINSIELIRNRLTI
jgi:HEAT repeat protein